MRLIIGGSAQGKLEYATTKYNVKPQDIITAENFSWEIDLNKKTIYGFHNIIKQALKDSISSEKLVEFVLKNPPQIIISDEVGCGIVPFDEFERNYRETTGRIMCQLAKKAISVERVICGLSQVIKNG